MKAHIPINAKTRKEIDSFAHRAVLKERSDIATRAMYLCLLAMDQAGLSPRTMRRVRDLLPSVTKKYTEYRIEQLADLWAKTILEDKGVEVPATREPL